jgi:hypothetical protein
MEGEPDTENVVYLDEYPELKKKVWLRRLNTQRLGGAVIHQFQTPNVTELPHRQIDTPDGAA